MVTHPTGIHYADSLSNLVADYFREKNESVCVRPVGRLDQETSGIVIFAKNQVAASRLQSVKSPCKIHKQYLAVVSGALPVDAPDVWHTINLPYIPLYYQEKSKQQLLIIILSLPVRIGHLSHLNWTPDVPIRSVSICLRLGIHFLGIRCMKKILLKNNHLIRMQI